MAKTDYRTIDQYHDVFPEETQERMEQVRNLIKKIVPESEEVISYQIPAFKIGKKFLIYYAAFPNHISLSSPWSEAFLKNFETDLEDLKISKSAIQFPNNKPFPLDLIKKMIAFRKKELD
ncbi:DUF1801 domain-containing protein [Sphingobacterium sp. SRCM116780]|uniref:iron chaperone n=1 Tax=Sphingobacterium sp. SRCM116780 TaxID=2907623 RepID=UPI001F261760|nr:DUF1801 domain-containing protein [Sphingobacterium sp. SRCM116780]UIR57297.1 DUF1801 domain-containing protein [Sphingobacterium sp. SRCM116780]